MADPTSFAQSADGGNLNASPIDPHRQPNAVANSDHAGDRMKSNIDRIQNPESVSDALFEPLRLQTDREQPKSTYVKGNKVKMLIVSGETRFYMKFVVEDVQRDSNGKWTYKLKDKDTVSVSSATITERGGIFTIRYRRAAQGETSDEVSIFGADPGAIPHTPDEAEIGELADLLRRMLPPAERGLPETGLIA